MLEKATATTQIARQAEEDKAPLGQALLQLAHAADEVRHPPLQLPSSILRRSFVFHFFRRECLRENERGCSVLR